VLRGLTECDIFKLLGQLQERVPGPIPSTTSGAPEVGSSSTSLQMISVANIGNTIHLDTTPPPDFQRRLVLHQEAISSFSLAGNTGNDAISGFSGNEGVTATSSPREALTVPPSLFSKSKETSKHSQACQVPFSVRRPDTGNEAPVHHDLRGARYQPSGQQESLLP
jgi:hypothetical protein